MASLFTNCFGQQKEPPLLDRDTERLPKGSPPPAGQRQADAVNPAKCVFCNVTPDKFNIVLQDADFICFTDRSPAAAVHLLVIPRTHIANVKSLTSQDAKLVRRMQTFGAKALDIVADSAPGTKPASPETRFGFHIPPFRSVDHLHLHCLQLPFRRSLKALKYKVALPPSPQYYKGWSWFAEWAQTCALLEAGRNVKVSSC